jgi:hypothetical protein
LSQKAILVSAGCIITLRVENSAEKQVSLEALQISREIKIVIDI